MKSRQEILARARERQGFVPKSRILRCVFVLILGACTCTRFLIMKEGEFWAFLPQPILTDHGLIVSSFPSTYPVASPRIKPSRFIPASISWIAAVPTDAPAYDKTSETVGDTPPNLQTDPRAPFLKLKGAFSDSRSELSQMKPVGAEYYVKAKSINIAATATIAGTAAAVGLVTPKLWSAFAIAPTSIVSLGFTVVVATLVAHEVRDILRAFAAWFGRVVGRVHRNSVS